MPGQGWRNTKRSTETPEQGERRRAVDAGLRQEHREGVPPNAPVDTEKAISAAKRASAAAAGPGSFAQQPKSQANAYGPPVAPGSAPE
jgi:hypothetical protein